MLTELAKNGDAKNFVCPFFIVTSLNTSSTVHHRLVSVDTVDMEIGFVLAKFEVV
jgi:hypothetical protein